MRDDEMARRLRRMDAGIPPPTLAALQARVRQRRQRRLAGAGGAVVLVLLFALPAFAPLTNQPDVLLEPGPGTPAATPTQSQPSPDGTGEPGAPSAEPTPTAVAPTRTEAELATCRSEADGLVVRYPAEWNTNDPRTTEPCRFFHPEPFAPPSPTETFHIDPGIAVQLRFTGEPFLPAVSGVTGASGIEVLAEAEETVAERRAIRLEWRTTAEMWGLPQGTRAAQYLVDLGSRTLFVTTPDSAIAGTYHGNRSVLDQIVESLVLPSAPISCSAGGQSTDVAPGEEPGLPTAVAERRRAIFHAAVECDYQRLAELAGERFTYSFGEEGDFAAFLERQEADGREPLRYLVELLDRPYAVVESPQRTQYVWPSAFAFDDWREVPQSDREALRPLYDEDDFADFERFGSYIGYRVGISADGDWLSFVAGD